MDAATAATSTRSSSAKGLKQMNDTGALETIVDEVLAANPKSVDEYRAGKDKAFNALVGQAMKATQGQGQPGAGQRAAEEEAGLTDPASQQRCAAIGQRSTAFDAGDGRGSVLAVGGGAAAVSSGPSEPGGAPAHSFFSRASSASKQALMRPILGLLVLHEARAAPRARRRWRRAAACSLARQRPCRRRTRSRQQRLALGRAAP